MNCPAPHRPASLRFVSILVALFVAWLSQLPAFAQATYEARHEAFYDDISGRKINLGQTDGPHRAGRTGFWTTQGRLQRGMATWNPGKVWGELKTTITNADGEQDAYGGNGGFSGWPGMDTYMRWQHLMPQDVKDAYAAEYLGMVTYGRGSTPNQRMMWAAACRLACETWGTTAVTTNSNASNKTGEPTGKGYIERICDRTVKYNFEERWAKHYLAYTLGPLRSIADLSSDPVLANKARMTWNWGWMDLASLSFKGRWSIPAGRGALTQDGNSSDISEHGSWLMFGGTPRANPLDADQSLNVTQPAVGVPYSVTQPPIIPEMLEAATKRDVPYTRRGLARVHETQWATTYMTKDWTMYSEVEGDTTLNSDGTLKIKDLNNNGVPSNDWASERWAVMWDESGPAGLTMKPPTGYGWAQGSGLGPHEDVMQHEGTLVGVINFPTDWTWKYTRDNVPTNTTAVIDDSATTGRLFLHYSKVLVAITRSDIGNFSLGDEYTYSDKRGFAVECASLSEYPQTTAEARLAAFKADILAHPADTSHVNDATPRMIYTTRAGTVMDITWGQAGKVDGSPIDYEGWPLNESPWSYQSQMGNMWVFGKDRKLLWNYKNWTESVDHAPTATTTAPIAASGAAPVEVDLSTRIADAETASSALKYRVSGATNGVARLLADGRTVRFMPAANFSGASTFTVTAGGPFPDHRYVAFYDNEGTAIGKDVSTNERHATSSVGGIASANRVTDVPAATASADNTRSLRLVSGAFGTAKISRSFYPATLNFSNHDWTFATWVKRESYADDDFLFYVGDGDGFGGDGEELQVWLPAQSKTVAVRHYNGSNSQTFSLASPATLDAGKWHHVAVQFSRTSHNTGVVKLYLDGELAATSASVTWALKQTGPVFIGGPAQNTALTRGLSGWIDDTVLARGVLSADEIAELASAPASHLGGMKSSHTITVNSAVLAPSGLSAFASNNTVSLSWNAVGGAASYSVKRGTSAAGPFTTIASGLTSASHTDATAVPGTTYYYVVTATNGVGESGNSNVANTAIPTSDATIWNSGAMSAWSHGARIAFPGYAGSETLVNFPMLVRLDAANVPGFSYAQLAFGNGSDLRFTDANGVELSYEIESWNPNGTSLVWVRVPSLSKGGSIIAYWGNPSATATISPDALGGLAMWLKADALPLADGATVSTWTDSSSNARNATLAQGAPVFASNQLNGKPVVRFTPNGESSFTFPTMTNIRTVFWVAKESAAAPHFLLGDDNTYHFHRGTTGGNIWDATYSSSNVRNGVTRLNGASINGTTTPLGSGWKLVSLVTSGNVEASRLARDRSIAGRSWDGDVAEVIVYDRPLTANEELLVGGYLAQKYGLTTAYAGAAPGYTSDGSTWSGGFTGVWHLNSTNVTDSTSVPQNTNSNATMTTGKVASALNHDGASQHAIIPNAADVNVANNYELSGWFRIAPGDKTNWRTLWAKETDSATRNWWLSVNGSGQVWWTSSAGIDITSTTDLADNQWHYVSAVHDGSYARLYIDGVQAGIDSAPGSEEQTTWAVRLGSENSTRWWKGALDEFRISNVKRSATWVRAIFDNINTPTWVRSGNVTPKASGFTPMVSSRAASSVGGTTATLNGNLASTGGSTTNVILYHGPTDGGTNPAAWAGSLSLGARSVGNFSGNISGLANGSTRYCRAFASNATGSAWAAETVSFVTDTVSPTGLSATPGSGLVNFTWTATPGAGSYVLKRGSSAAGPFTTLLSNILTPAASDTSAADGSTYYYVVSAVNAGGESANSAAVPVSTLVAPGDLVATAGNASVALGWSPVSGATSYTVKRSLTSEGTYSIVQAGIAGASFTDTTAVNGTTYFYVVTASNSTFESDLSNEASATPGASVPTPIGLTGTPADTSALLSWNAVSGATHYRVKRSTVSGGPYTTVGDPVFAPSFTSTGLTNGTPFFFVVSAMNGSVESANSAQITVTPGPTPTTFTTSSAGTWSAATWSPQQPFSGFQSTVVFNNSTAVSSTANLGTLIANKLNLSNAAVTLGGDPLFLLGTAPGITTTANAAHSISNNLTLDGVNTMNIASNTTTLSGVLNGGGSVTKTGAGTLVLSGANTHTGATTVSAGVLNIRHADALGSADATVASGAVLEIQGGITVGGRRVTVTGSGNNGALKNVSGDNTWAGDVSAVAVSGITRIASDAGTLTLSGEITQSSGSSDQLVFQGNGNIMVTGAIDGVSNVTRSSTGSGVVSLIGDNTYTGQTILNGGVTEVESISSLVGDPGDEEVALNASGLGAPQTTAKGTITMGFSTTSATLRYIGPTLKTDRVIALAGSTGGATIEQNGSGTLTLLSAFTATGAGTKTLTLSGIGDGVAAGAIVDNSATNKTNLVKSGTGTWTIGGVNAYSGSTTVSAGTLLMTGSIAAGGNVTVSSGSTFGGSGTVTPNTTVNGNLALKGTLNFGGSLTFGAGARVKLNVADNSTTAGKAVASTATLSSGAVVDVTFNGTGSLVDFSNPFWSATRTWPIVTAASRTGNFTLGSVSPDIAGRPVAGYGAFTISQTSTAANLVWTPLSAIEQWRFTYFGTNANAGSAADNADPDSDGVINLAEFNGGSNPNDALSIPTFIFNNLAGGNWSTGANWNTGVAPVSNAATAVEIFTGQTLSGTIATPNDLAGTFTLNSLRLGGTGSGTVVNNVTGAPLRFVANGENSPFIQLGAFSTNVSVNVANNFALDADMTVKGTNSGNFTFSGIISGPGGITRTESYSTFTLSGINTYTGPTVLQSGVTAISRAENFGAASAPLTLDGGTLRINSTLLPGFSAMGRTITFAPGKKVSLDVASSTHTFTADLVLNQEDGGLDKLGSGTLALTQANTYSGATSLLAGTLAVSADNQLGDPAAPLVFNGGTLRINGSSLTSLADLGRTITFTATKTVGIDIAEATHTFEISRALDQTTGGLTKLGAGTLELNTPNTFSGNVTISAGTLRISQAAALGGATKSVFSTTGTGRLELDGAGSDITIPATTTLLTSGIQASGALRNVSGNNTIAGPILLTTGAGNTQIIGDGGSLTLAGAITTSPSAGARTLLLGGNAGGLVTGNISDNGGTNVVSVTKNGTGAWELRGSNTYTGATTLTAGRLALSGTLTSSITASAGTLAPLGTSSTTANLNLQSGGRLEVRALTDTLSIGGTVTLSGALDVVASPGIAGGTIWTILNKTSPGAISGTFSGKPQGAIFAAGGYNWQISYTGGDGNDVTLAAQALTPIELWRMQYFGSSLNAGTGADLADSNGDGEVNLLEFATGQNPSTATRSTPVLVKNGAVIEFNYTRSLDALAGGLGFVVEWSDTLAPNTWSSAGVTEQILTDNGTTQVVKASLGSGSGRRFFRLRISRQ